MRTIENNIRLCADCPNRGWEGLTEVDEVTGDLVERGARYMNQRLEMVSGPEETPDVPTQEFGAYFIDSEGNRTSAFLPGTQLEDIAECNGPVVTERYGVLWLKKRRDCGAQALRLVALRERMYPK